jgi:septal ring factor EnvC (AmiA/AmiB activator)
MIDIKELRVSAANSVKDLALLPSEVLELLDRLEAAEKELAELRSSMKFRTSLIGRTEAERDALRAALRHETDCAEAAKAKIEALRSKIEAIEKQEPFDADSDVFRGAFEAALKAGNWPATRQGDGYRSPSTQIAWRIAFSTVNRLKLYLAPVAQGE